MRSFLIKVNKVNDNKSWQHQMMRIRWGCWDFCSGQSGWWLNGRKTGSSHQWFVSFTHSSENPQGALRKTQSDCFFFSFGDESSVPGRLAGHVPHPHHLSWSEELPLKNKSLAPSSSSAASGRLKPTDLQEILQLSGGKWNNSFFKVRICGVSSAPISGWWLRSPDDVRSTWGAGGPSESWRPNWQLVPRHSGSAGIHQAVAPRH